MNKIEFYHFLSVSVKKKAEKEKNRTITQSPLTSLRFIATRQGKREI